MFNNVLIQRPLTDVGGIKTSSIYTKAKSTNIISQDTAAKLFEHNYFVIWQYFYYMYANKFNAVIFNDHVI